MAGNFVINARLAADSALITAWELCDVRLMRDARWQWLILVPRIKGAEEITDLTRKQREMLMEETAQAAAALQKAGPCDKLNIGALGNIVRQLHIHVIARNEGDAGWPGSVWGFGRRQEMTARQEAERLEQLRLILAD